VVDPVGGSYYIESLTSKIEAEVEDYLKRIEEMGGAIKAVESGFIQKEIQDAAYEYHQEVEAGRKQVVGVNCFHRRRRRTDSSAANRPRARDKTG
jgi:methylmalonyl-CoA mutase N-terminal domain/subunit